MRSNRRGHDPPIPEVSQVQCDPSSAKDLDCVDYGLRLLSMIRLLLPVIPLEWRPFLRRMRRRVFELLGSDRFSRPSQHDIDRKIQKYLPQRNGFFIEAGANDGYSQSNTYYLGTV